MAISTESALIAALPGQQKPFIKTGGTGKGAGLYHSMWTTTGLPGAGAAAGSINGAIPTSATNGTIAFTNPTGGQLSYLARLACSSTQQAHITLYDRLWHDSAFSATLTTSQAVTQPALTRYTTGAGVELWVEIYTATTNTATATITYTNSAGTASRSTTVVIPAATVAGQMVPVPLQAGDAGVRSVQSAQLSATMAAGNWGLTLMSDIASFPVNANSGVVLNAYDLGMPTIEDNAALVFMCLLSSTTVPQITGELNISQG